MYTALRAIFVTLISVKHLIFHDHLDITEAFENSFVSSLLQVFISISYTKNVMPLTGNARIQSIQNPWKKRLAPPSMYVFFIQSHGPL